MTPGRVVLGVNPLAVVPRVLAVVVAAGACFVAWRCGGGAEAAAPPPGPSSSAAATGTTPSAQGVAGDGYEVSVRLVDIANEARFGMPRAESARGVMNAHWRRQKPPFVPTSGDAARFVTMIALRTSASEAQSGMPVGKERKAWAPDARVWNMNEGSFDQREALVSPTPGSITFRVNVPRGAKLTFAEGMVNATDEATAFIVSVLDGRGTQHEVHRHVLQPGDARRWTEMTCDLSAFAGQQVELRFATEGTKAISATQPDDVRGARDARRRPKTREPSAPASGYGGPGNARNAANTDGGAVREDVLGTPSATVALWGNPTLLARTTPRVPYNVLWIVVDALRPDVIASFHDDAEDVAKQTAPLPPLEALLPKIPGLTPEIDDLAKRGVRFTHAYSAGSWTRPGTLAMLAGARSSFRRTTRRTWRRGSTACRRSRSPTSRAW